LRWSIEAFFIGCFTSSLCEKDVTKYDTWSLSTRVSGAYQPPPPPPPPPPPELPPPLKPELELGGDEEEEIALENESLNEEVNSAGENAEMLPVYHDGE
jgi:hypothetical protein